ncbi:hypothetical protein H0H92_005429 [Tricholoma furcatifolium]|nr:hypothetical protein H0H92_005429 [Tricholoma furcatifolium]
MSESTAIPASLLDSLARHEATVVADFTATFDSLDIAADLDNILATLESFTESVETFDIGHGEKGFLIKQPTLDGIKSFFRIAIGPLEANCEINLKELTLNGENVFHLPFLQPIQVLGGVTNLKDSPSWNLEYPGIYSGVEGFRLEGNSIIYWYNFVFYGRRYEGNNIVGDL